MAGPPVSCNQGELHGGIPNVPNYPIHPVLSNADCSRPRIGGKSQGPLNGGVSNGGVSRSGLVLPFLSFFVLFGTFPIFLGFSRFARGWSGDFPD